MPPKIKFFSDPTAEASQAQPTGHELNFECCECGAPANWGEGVSLLHGREGMWFCARHVPDRLRYPTRRLTDDPALRDSHVIVTGGSSQRA